MCPYANNSSAAVAIIVARISEIDFGSILVISLSACTDTFYVSQDNPAGNMFHVFPSSLPSGLSFLNIGSGTGYFSCLAGCILQAQGINHGIELHEDLVHFAKERVEEFLRFSPSVAYDMCPPKFIAGNCFRLDPTGCSYDRVYCGAACPASKAPFILSLTKIGGFAIIPCRDRVRFFHLCLLPHVWELTINNYL